MAPRTQPPTAAAAAGSQDDLRLALRAAMLYHLDGLTQADIARRLGVSRPTAGRLIARARSQGLVRIEVALPPHLRGSVHADLERSLESRFDLTEVVIVPDADENESMTMTSLGRSAAAVLARRLQPDHRLGLAWGRTMAALADALPPRAARCTDVVQLDGSASAGGYRTYGEYIISTCAEQLGATPYPLNAPLYADAATVESLGKDSRMSQAIARANACDVVMFSVGDLSGSTTLFSDNVLDRDLLVELADKGAVGDACGRFFDADGRDVDGGLADRTVAVRLDELRSCPLSVLVAGGRRKRESILGALRGGLADVLVTDDRVAAWLLENENRPEVEP